MQCSYVYAPEEIVNGDFPHGQLFNCEGKVYSYDKEIYNLRPCGENDVEVRMRDFKGKKFFTGIWYRGGNKCKKCENRICGIDAKFFIESPKVKGHILAAAIWVKDGHIHPHQPVNITSGFVILGRRHHNILTTLASLGIVHHEHTVIQGFLTVNDYFVDRAEGYHIALAHNQCAKKNTPALYSEDMY